MFRGGFQTRPYCKPTGRPSPCAPLPCSASFAVKPFLALHSIHTIGEDFGYFYLQNVILVL